MNELEVLEKYFGYTSFRDGQKKVISSILSKKDTLAIMPTGAGKSLCYQVPALMMDGILLVVSPLISLMVDQVFALKQIGIKAAFINSALSESQCEKALKNAKNGEYKIIYVAPERLLTARFLSFAKSVKISMIAIDEAHCVSCWGQDFRPSYLDIAEFIEKLENRPIISAFTATATKKVEDDIKKILKLQNKNTIITSFDRPNLFYGTVLTKDKLAFLLDFISKHKDESGIIYCATRKNVVAVYEALKSHKISVCMYHAGMSQENRMKAQNDFIFDKASICVATNAFGMGIDKSNVRFVLHYNMPYSMENYYQEAGRAGRDGERSECILLFSENDININRFLLEQKSFDCNDFCDVKELIKEDYARLNFMEKYAKSCNCLRQKILSYFNEKTTQNCNNCSCCLNESKKEDFSAVAKIIVDAVNTNKTSYGKNMLVDILCGAKTKKIAENELEKLSFYGTFKNSKKAVITKVVDYLIEIDVLAKSDAKLSVINLGKNSENIDKISVLIPIKDIEDDKKAAKKESIIKIDDSIKNSDLFLHLKRKRLEISIKEKVPPYIVFSDKTLAEMCIKRAVTKEQMMKISGVAQVKFARYGEDFIKVIRDFVEAE